MTFIVFIVSLGLIVLLFAIKNLEIYHGRKIFLENLFSKCDVLILKIILKIKFWWSHISFKNTKLIFSWVIVNTKKLIITIKRRFDHKQSHFFTKRDHNISINKNSASFFLKHMAEYKKGLREGGSKKV